ncbi:hypothetical protein HK097_003319, partial [Rhizophlyctis rosea]
MVRFKAINEEVTAPQGEAGEEQIPLEIQIEQAFEAYSRALRLQARKNLLEAREAYEALSNTDAMQIPLSEDGTVHGSPLHKLHYLLHKNWGSLEEAEGRFDEALDHYREAIDIDNTDPTLWSKIGKLEMQACHLTEAREAFQEGLRRADTGVSRFACLSGLCEISYDIGDFQTCIRLINQILEEDPWYDRGLWIKSQIVKEAVECRDLTSGIDESITPLDIMQFRRRDLSGLNLQSVARERRVIVSGAYDVPQPPITMTVEQPTWACFAETLLSTYHSLMSSRNPDTATSSLNIIVSGTDEVDEHMPDVEVTNADESVVIETETVGDESVDQASQASQAMQAREEREDSPGKKRKRGAEEVGKRDIAPRSSKRVRDKLEHTTNAPRKSELDQTLLPSLESLNKYFPPGISIRYGPDAFMMADLGQTVESLVSTPITNQKVNPRSRAKKSKTAPRRFFARPVDEEEMESGPVDGRFTRASLMEFVEGVGGGRFGILEVMRRFVRVVLGGGGQGRWPDGVRQGVVGVLLALERGGGIWEGFCCGIGEEEREWGKELETMLSTTELLFDHLCTSPPSCTEDTKSNPLNSMNVFDVLQRVLTVTLELLHLHGEDGVDQRTLLRIRWVQAGVWEYLGNAEKAAEVLRGLEGI